MSHPSRTRPPSATSGGIGLWISRRSERSRPGDRCGNGDTDEPSWFRPNTPLTAGPLKNRIPAHQLPRGGPVWKTPVPPPPPSTTPRPGPAMTLRGPDFWNWTCATDMPPSSPRSAVLKSFSRLRAWGRWVLIGDLGDARLSGVHTHPLGWIPTPDDERR